MVNGYYVFSVKHRILNTRDEKINKGNWYEHAMGNRDSDTCHRIAEPFNYTSCTKMSTNVGRLICWVWLMDIWTPQHPPPLLRLSLGSLLSPKAVINVIACRPFYMFNLKEIIGKNHLIKYRQMQVLGPSIL